MHKIAICDDELGVCSSLEESILKFFNERSEKCEIEVWNDSETLCREIAGFNPMILFLDIELPQNNGVYVGKYIREKLKNDRMNIIFISHKTNYAMELFQIHPYDFLVKPIKTMEIFKTLMEVLKLEEVQNKEFRYTYYKTGYAIPYGEIMCFYSRDKSVFIKRTDGDTSSYYGKLKDILNDLPFQFVCISKSNVVNMKYVKSWSNNTCTLEDGTVLNVAQSKRQEFKKAIFDYGTTGGKS